MSKQSIVETILNKYTPLGGRVLVKVVSAPIEEKTDSGLIIARTSENNRQEAARECGEVLWLGKYAFKSYYDGEPWCDVGDRVVFVRYAGREIIEVDDDTGEVYRLRFIEDQDLFAKLNHGEYPFHDKIPTTDESKLRLSEDDIVQEKVQEQMHKNRVAYDRARDAKYRKYY